MKRKVTDHDLKEQMAHYFPIPGPIEGEEVRVTCPDWPAEGTDLLGCGRTFLAVADHDGLVDCHHCGLVFRPEPREEQL